MTLPAFLTQVLAYLLYFDLGTPFTGFQNQNCIALKIGTAANFGNRVYSNTSVTQEDINQVKNFYSNLPFQWWVDETQSNLKTLLEQNGFVYRISFPAMKMDISNIKCTNYDPAIEIKQITNSTDIATWIEIASTSFAQSIDDIQKLINYMLEHTPKNNFILYLGYFNGTPAATSMAIQYEDTVALHWVATLPSFRSKGLGFAVTYQALIDGAKKNVSTALLFASVLGKPLYEKMGFKTLFNCHIYAYNPITRDVIIKKSEIGQFSDGLGVFANRDFKKGEVVIKWNLKTLTHEQYTSLSDYDKHNFCHIRNGNIYYYPDPERHVNRSPNPNVLSDIEREANIALRNIKKGEEISISETTVEDF